MNLVIIFFIILLILLVFIYYKNRHTNYTPDVIIPDTPSAINCGILSGSTIKSCANDPTMCENCVCSSDPRQKLGCMKCQDVDGDKNNTYKKIYGILENACTGDYMSWDPSDSSCTLKDGKYCLPVIPPDITCNPYTGTKTLSFNPTTHVYEYTCVCNNSSKFSNIGTDGGDCDYIHLCGINSTQNPSSNDRTLVNTSDQSAWTSQSTWDPILNGTCVCAPNEVFVKNTMSCMVNNCNPGSPISGDPTRCSCPPGFVSCSDISQRQDKGGSTYYTGDCAIPSCVPDPCIGVNGDATYNMYDKSTNSCKCGNPTDLNNSWTSLASSGNGFNQTCVDVCRADLDPCEGRGSCYLYKESNANSVWGITTSSDTPNKFLITNTTLNKALLSTLKLSDPGGGGNLFYIETSGTTDQAGNPSIIQVSQIFPGDKYCFKLDQTGNSYINFSTLSTNNTVQNASIVTLIATPFPDQYRLNVGNMFLEGNDTTISLVMDFLNTARCENCDMTKGYLQDDDQLCNKYCTTDLVGPCGQCCPGTACSYDWGTARYDICN